MNLRGNKGITGVDLSVALVIIVLFVGLVATLIYNFGLSSKGVNRTAVATNIAIAKLEELKNQNYDSLQEKTTEYKDESGTTQTNAPYEVITEITKYAKSDYVKNLSAQEIANLQDVIKIAKVTVKYTVGKKIESIDLSTVLIKEN